MVRGDDERNQRARGGGELGERVEWEGGSDRTSGEEPRFAYIQLPASEGVEVG